MLSENNNFQKLSSFFQILYQNNKSSIFRLIIVQIMRYSLTRPVFLITTIMQPQTDQIRK